MWIKGVSPSAVYIDCSIPDGRTVCKGVSSLALAEPQRVHERVYADAATIGILTSAAKLVGAAKVVIMARFFGTTDQLDAFLIAFLLPSFLSDVVAGSLTPCLIPQLVKSQTPRRMAAWALTAALGVMSIAALGLAIAGHWLLPLAASSFSAQKLRLAEALLLGLLLWLPMSACIAICRAVLNANGRFALAAIATMGSPLMTIALLYVLPKQWGVTVLCAGTVGGVGLEWLVLAVSVRRLGYPILPAWPDWTSTWMKQLGRQYIPLAASAIILSACTVVDQSVAGRLGSGQVSALAYGTKLAAVLLAIAGSSLGTAVLPAFSRMAATEDWAKIRKTVWSYCGTIAAFSLPATFALIAGSGILIRAVFEHGAFGESATQLVTQVQRYALLETPFAMVLAVVTRLTAALSANALLLPMGIAALTTNVIFDLLFSRWFGVAGIALATAVVRAVSLAVLILLLRRHVRRWCPAE
jgi:putative peptidoglycan lipid II flippase